MQPEVAHPGRGREQGGQPAAVRCRSCWPAWPRRPTPPAAAWLVIAISCGLATITAAAAPAPSRQQPRRGRAADQPRQQRRRASSTAITADSWLTSTAAPEHQAQDHALAQPGRRRSRTAASSVIGRNSVPSAMLRWNQSCQATIEDRPKKRAGGDRARLAQPQPGGAVHRVAQQARACTIVSRLNEARRAEDQRDRGHDQPGQRHQGVEAELDADRRGHAAGEERVAQVSDLVRDPPQAPDVLPDVAHRRQPVPGQVAGLAARSARSRRPGKREQDQVPRDRASTRTPAPGACRRWLRARPLCRPAAAAAAGRRAACRGLPARSRPRVLAAARPACRLARVHSSPESAGARRGRRGPARLAPEGGTPPHRIESLTWHSGRVPACACRRIG